MRNVNNMKTGLSERAIKNEINESLSQVQQLLDTYFVRSETKESAFSYIQGLISPIERKNSWQLSEQAGCGNPYAFQYLLGRALWDADALGAEVRGYTVSHLGREDGILSIDETGFLKKGEKSAGVGRQYSGTAGRIENCQIGVFLSYATSKGRALIDRELYIPAHWFEDKNRCKEAGIPAEKAFKTKPELAREMLKRTFETDINPAWVVGDEVYSNGALRTWLEKQKQAYVLAVASNAYVCKGMKQYKAKTLSANILPEEWETISAGEGTKGQRYYEWHRLKINSDSPKGWSRWLMFRRNIKNVNDIAFYISYSPNTKTLEDMAKAAGSRWTIEECFEMAKGEVGLDQYEVRSWIGWYRHITLSLLALSLLVKLRYQLSQKELTLVKKKHQSKRTPMKEFLQSRGLL